MNETYTVKQVADILGFSTNSIYTFLKQGRIKGVRVGKGRFRITEEELGRILHLSKKQQPDNETKLQTEKVKLTDSVDLSEQLKLSVIKLPHPHVDVESIFDWFVGMVSIVVGFSLFLFSQYLNRPEAFEYASWTLPIQVSLISSGVGMIITDIFRNKSSLFWHRVFQFILTITYFGLSYSRYNIGEAGSGLIFGLFGVCLILTTVFQLRGVDMLLFFIGIFTIGSSITLLNKTSVPWIIEIALENSSFASYFIIILAIILMILTWWSHQRKKRMFWLLMLTYGVVFTLLSFWFAGNLSWSKAFFVLSLGLTTVLTPVWETISLQKKIDRKLAAPIFIGMLTVITVMVGVLWLMEQNMKEFSQRELKNKLEYGQLLVDSTLDSVEKSVSGASRSKVLLESLTGENKENVKEAIRLLIEGNPNIRTAWVLDLKGDLVSIYPHVILTETNFFTRDYFRQATSGKTYITNLFTAKTKDKRNAVVISSPIFADSGNEILAVLAFSLNLDNLSTRLQKFTSQENGESFILVDKKERILVSRDPTQIGKLNDIYENSESRGIKDYESNLVIEKTGWNLKIKAPMREILRPTRTVSISLFGGISLIVFFVSAYLFLIKKIHLISL